MEDDHYQCNVVPSRYLKSYFNRPVDSQVFDICAIQKSNVPWNRKVVNVHDIKRKVVCIPTGDNFVFLPLFHDF